MDAGESRGESRLPVLPRQSLRTRRSSLSHWSIVALSHSLFIDHFPAACLSRKRRWTLAKADTLSFRARVSARAAVHCRIVALRHCRIPYSLTTSLRRVSPGSGDGRWRKQSAGESRHPVLPRQSLRTRRSSLSHCRIVALWHCRIPYSLTTSLRRVSPGSGDGRWRKQTLSFRARVSARAAVHCRIVALSHCRIVALWHSLFINHFPAACLSRKRRWTLAKADTVLPGQSLRTRRNSWWHSLFPQHIAVVCPCPLRRGGASLVLTR